MQIFLKDRNLPARENIPVQLPHTINHTPDIPNAHTHTANLHTPTIATTITTPCLLHLRPPAAAATTKPLHPPRIHPPPRRRLPSASSRPPIVPQPTPSLLLRRRLRNRTTTTTMTTKPRWCWCWSWRRTTSSRTGSNRFLNRGCLLVTASCARGARWSRWGVCMCWGSGKGRCGEWRTCGWMLLVLLLWSWVVGCVFLGCEWNGMEWNGMGGGFGPEGFLDGSDWKGFFGGNKLGWGVGTLFEEPWILVSGFRRRWNGNLTALTSSTLHKLSGLFEPPNLHTFPSNIL